MAKLALITSKKTPTISSIFLSILVLLFVSCGSSENDNDNSDNTDPVDPVDETHIFNLDLMNENNLLEGVNLVNATLSDGSTAACYQLVFKSNPIEDDGPYCPETTNDVGGIGFYDGSYTSGDNVLFRLDANLWDIVIADGYTDIVDSNGNVNIVVPLEGPPANGCISANHDDDLRLTFLIPAVPKERTSFDQIDEHEHLGISKDGIPIIGDPPSSTNRTPNICGIPSIDPCGGHPDPSGYYHLHFGAEEMDNVLLEHGIDQLTCNNITQSTTAFIGYAKDGYPMYASADEGDAAEEPLDDCLGHEGVTPDYPDGVYHYHISSSEAPNLPTCLKGVAPSQSFQYE